jgi:Spy/CpxP family protein refolding chaperone
MEAEWLVMIWRLPHGSSTPRVTTWRSLKRLGAASLTPGAAALPYTEDHLEQLGWLAQEVEEMGGDAWVLQVNQLTEAEEAQIRDQVSAERRAEYADLVREVQALQARSADQPPSARELGALRKRLARIRGRDHYGAGGSENTTRAIEELEGRQRPSPAVPLAAR